MILADPGFWNRLWIFRTVLSCRHPVKPAPNHHPISFRNRLIYLFQKGIGHQTIPSLISPLFIAAVNEANHEHANGKVTQAPLKT